MDGRADRTPDGAIDVTRAAFVSALGRRDAKAASALYTEGAMLVPPSAGLVEGRDAIRAYWQAGLDTGISAVALETLLLERHEPVAYEIGRYSLWLDGAEGAEASERGAYVLVHELQEDGSWLRAVEMFNPET